MHMGCPLAIAHWSKALIPKYLVPFVLVICILFPVVIFEFAQCSLQKHDATASFSFLKKFSNWKPWGKSILSVTPKFAFEIRTYSNSKINSMWFPRALFIISLVDQSPHILWFSMWYGLFISFFLLRIEAKKFG